MATPDDNRVSITICGDGGCGKSSITLRLVRSQWTSDYDPTIEDSYSITRRIDGQTYHLSLTDTAGQEEYRGMWGGNNLQSDAFLMVYDITSMASLEALTYFNDLIDMESETRLESAPRVRGKGPNAVALGVMLPVKIVAGNKCDLQDKRQVGAKTGLEWARRRGCGFMETSALNVVNIEETFALIVRRVIEGRRRAAAELGEGSDRNDRRPFGGGDANGARVPERGMEVDVGPYGAGTRRAVTAPLSPLPLGVDEKGRTIGQSEGGKGFWSKLKCW